ncbi:MAG: hypothetical protein IJ347_08040, partial [Faecalibacterium sp.]|nr:hypothetical protein [Faecalibacterium sp.]
MGSIPAPPFGLQVVVRTYILQVVDRPVNPFLQKKRKKEQSAGQAGCPGLGYSFVAAGFFHSCSTGSWASTTAA